MAEGSNTGPGLRDMAFAAAGGNRKSSNALVDAANKVFETYADQMAIAAAERQAARQEKREDKEGFRNAGYSRGEARRAVNKGEFPEFDQDGNKIPDSLQTIGTPDDKDGDGIPDTIDAGYDPKGESIYDNPYITKPTPTPATMRSPIKQSLYGAAFAAAGGFRKDTKNASELVDDLAKAAIEARRTTQRVLKEKVVKELDNFSPEVVDLEGFNGFMNGKNAVTNFGIDLKQQIAEKKDAALKLNPYSMEYKETMNEINSLVESTKNLNLEQMRLKNLKKEWGTSSKTNLYSKGSSKITMNYLEQVMSRDVAPMTLDENGKVQFEVLKVDSKGEGMFDADGNALTEIISFDDLNKDLYLKVELDVAPQIADYHTMIRKNVIDDLGFNKDANKTFWNTLIAPDEDSVNFDGELLSWIHDRPYNLYKGNKSFYDEFKDYYLPNGEPKTLAITADGEPLVMTQEALDILFDPDTRDWDAKTQDGRTVREYVREELINYYARTSEQYHYYTSRKQDLTSNTIGTAINKVQLP